MNSRHEGVSCDGCMAPNFTGDRYKCLRCYDFDLCSRCYAQGRKGKKDRSRDSSNNHQSNHPMQCIMTQQDFERTYRGDAAHSWDRSRVVIFTCPVCGAQGFSRERLVTHVMEEHPSSGPPTSSHSKREEMACPICISTYSYRSGFPEGTPNHLTDMAAHMVEYHVHTSPSTPSAGGGGCQSGQSVATGLTEYLRDEDLRRVILNNIPLMSDVEFDESFSENTRRHINALLSSNRGTVSALCHSRRRTERSSERSGHEEESSSQPNAPSSRSLSYVSRSSAFGRHWPVTTHRQSGASFFNSLPIRLRPLRQNDGENTRAVSLTTQSNAVFRSFIHRDSSANGSTSTVVSSRIAQPTGVLIRPVRRAQQQSSSSSDRTPSEATSRSQQFGRSSISRFSDFDRSTSNNSSRYGRELMRSFYESARRTEPSSMNRRKGLKGSVTSNGENSERAEQPNVSTTGLKQERDNAHKTDKPVFSQLYSSSFAANRLTATVGGSGGKSDLYFDDAVLKEPVFVEKAGKATLLLPQSLRLKSPETKDTNESLTDDKQQEECEVKKPKDVKLTSSDRNLKKKKQKQKQKREQQQTQLGRDGRLSWLKSYQPLFISSAELVAPLPTVYISTAGEDNSCKKIWDKPKKIPEPSLMPKEENLDVDSVSTVEDQLPSPTLILNVGRSFKCSYVPVGSSANGAASNATEVMKSDIDALSIRKTLDVIKKMEEAKRTEATVRTAKLSKKSNQERKVDEESQTHSKQNSSTMSQRNSTGAKVEELSRMDSVDRFQNAFKEAAEDVILGSSVRKNQLLFRPYHVVPEEMSSKLIKKWLGRERSEDGGCLGLGFHLDHTIKELMAEIPDFSDDDSVGRMDSDISDEEPMFDASEGTDNELLAKKCVSCGIIQNLQSHYAVGPLNAALNEKESFENYYWKNYRFLHNRRDALLLRKCIESPPESSLDSSDWRFARQLLLGVRDVPASRFLRCHFFDNTYEVALECNLRGLIRRQSELSSSEPLDLEEEPTADKSPDTLNRKFVMSFDDSTARVISDTKLISVHPALWHFLNLSGRVQCRWGTSIVKNLAHMKVQWAVRTTRVKDDQHSFKPYGRTFSYRHTEAFQSAFYQFMYTRPRARSIAE